MRRTVLVKACRFFILLIFTFDALIHIGFTTVQTTAQTDTEQQVAYTVSFEMAGIYAPAKFIVEFARWQNFSGPVNMQTFSGSSLWTAQSSPVGFEFDAKDIDTYEFDLHLIYNVTTDQVMTFSYWSGDLAPNAIRIRVVGNDLLIHFRLVVNTQPQIPSKEAIAEAVVMQVKQDLADFEGQVADLTVEFQQSQMVMWAVVGIALFAAILSLVVAFYAIRSSQPPKGPGEKRRN